MTKLSHDPQVVSHVKSSGLVFPHQVPNQIEDRCLCRGVEACCRLVQDQQLRFGAERHGDHDPLLHPTADLMRIAVGDPATVGDLHHLQQVQGTISRLLGRHAHVMLEHFDQLIPNRERRVEGGQWILGNEGHLGSPNPPHLFQGKAEQISPIEPDLARHHFPGPRQVMHDGKGKCRLARTALAHQAVCLAPIDPEVDVPDGLAHPASRPIANGQVFDLQQRLPFHFVHRTTGPTAVEHASGHRPSD